MLKTVAKAISILFHPIWMPLVGTYILLTQSKFLGLIPIEGQHAVYIIVASSTIGLPLLMFPLFWYRNKFKTLEMSAKQERYVPLVIMTVFYYFSFHTLSNLNAPALLSGFIFGSFISVFIAAIVNVWWKISLHAIGLGGITGLLVVIVLLNQGMPEKIFFQSIIYSGIALSARLYLNQHNMTQVLAGYACGFVSILTTLLLF